MLISVNYAECSNMDFFTFENNGEPSFLIRKRKTSDDVGRRRRRTVEEERKKHLLLPFEQEI